MATTTLYLDDSGSRHPDRSAGLVPAHGRDWFALGGILVDEEREASLRARHAAMFEKWRIVEPLHSSEIRARSRGFRWLRQLEPAALDEWMAELTALATSGEIAAVAAVVDRPGYNARYLGRYGEDRWLLCKTAFAIVVERAAKWARDRGRKLRVFVEKSDKRTDAVMRGYYEALRTTGAPFDATTSSAYQPLDAAALRETLYEFRTKSKSSPPMQIADVCLWPMCIGGYDPANRAYVAMRDAGTLIDCQLPPALVATRGIKYSCFELARAA